MTRIKSTASDYPTRLIGMTLLLRQAEMLQLVEQGWTADSVAQHYGMSISRVYQLVGPSVDVRSGRARARLLSQVRRHLQSKPLPDPVCVHVTQLLREEGFPMLASTMLPILERNGYKCDSTSVPKLCARLYQSGKFTHYSDGWWFKDEPRPAYTL